MTSLGAGIRKTTPESLAAQKYAANYELGRTKLVSRNDALRIAKLAAAAMGLKSSKIALIDQLFACSKASDWESKKRKPIVWPSNSRLAQRMGIGVSTMKHHLNGLVRAGLIAYSDGPTYQRRGRRDKDGNIVEAVGIDLSPITVRFSELSEIVAAAEYEAKESRRLSYRRTVLRKEIQSLILSANEQNLDGPWNQAQARLDVIRENRAKGIDELRDQVIDLEALKEEMEDIYDEMIQDINFDAVVLKFRPLQTTADSNNPELSNINGDALTRAKLPVKTAYGSMAFEKKPRGRAHIVQQKQTPSGLPGDDLEFLSLDLVRESCPTLTNYDPHVYDNWQTLRESGHDLCMAAGINPQVWQEAIEFLGRDVAIAALAVTIEKNDAGLVQKPGAYMRALARRGGTGDLHISRSLFGMINRKVENARRLEQNPPREAKAFPKSGSISFGSWGAVARAHAPKPTPDVDVLATSFRQWSSNKGIDLSSPNIERIFIKFCQTYRMNCCYRETSG